MKLFLIIFSIFSLSLALFFGVSRLTIEIIQTQNNKQQQIMNNDIITINGQQQTNEEWIIQNCTYRDITNFINSLNSYQKQSMKFVYVKGLSDIIMVIYPIKVKERQIVNINISDTSNAIRQRIYFEKFTNTTNGKLY